MPISPQDAIKASYRTAEELASPHFATIDKILSSPGKFPKYYGASGLSSEVMDAIRASYMKVGWKVQFSSGFDNETSLEFNPPVMRDTPRPGGWT